MSEVEVNRAEALDGVAHGFLGRRGGVSKGLYAGLNVGLGSEDDPATIAANRALAVGAVLPGATLLQPYQVHSADCVTVFGPWDDALRPHADAIVTATPGLALGILTADCVPVLFADREAGVVGAAHAGWKGAISGVTDATLLAMDALGAKRERIAAAIGPCIQQPSYEVDAGFRQRFVAADAANDRFFVAGRADHYQFDLPGYVAAHLSAEGIATVEDLGLDTYPLQDRFYSFRRATHRGEPGYGRQIALIGL
jgi:polyphenol oxidase